MLKRFLFLVPLVILGCDRVHRGTVLNLDPLDERVLDARSVNQTVDNVFGKSAEDLTLGFINSYNEQNGTNFTAFVSREPIDTSRQRVVFNGMLVEAR